MKFLPNLRKKFARRTQRYPQRRMFEQLENRIVFSTVAWTNLGPGDGLEAFEDETTEVSEAVLARNVLLQATAEWSRVIDDFNFMTPPDQAADVLFTLNVNADPADPSDGVCSAFAGTTASTADDFKPTAGQVTLNYCASGTLGDGTTPDMSSPTSWWFDPTPNDSSEFLGGMVNAFRSGATPGGAADGGRDLLGLIIHEMGHVMGFSGLLYNTDLGGSSFQTPSGNATVTDTGVANLVSGAVGDTYWAFQGPSVNALMTNFDIGGTASNARHNARPLADNAPVEFNGVPIFGSRDVMNGTGITSGGRSLLSNKAALILQDAYGYTINLPEQFGTMHAVLDESNGTLTVRGGGDNTVIDGVCQGGSFDEDDNCNGADSDVISILFDGDEIVVSVDVDHDVAGAGAGLDPFDQRGAFVTRFPLANVSQVIVNAGDGHDEITVGDGLEIPVIVNGQGGDDTLFPLFDSTTSNMKLHFTGGVEVDEVRVELDGDVTVNDSGLCLTDTGACLVANIEFHDQIDAVHITGGPADNIFDAEGFSGHATLIGDDGQDILRVGHEDAVLDGGNGNDSFFAGLGNNNYAGDGGYDTLFVEGTFDDDLYILNLFGSGLEEVALSMLDGDDDVTVLAPAGIVLTISGGPDNDTLDLSGSLSPVEVVGGLGNDTITGSPVDDLLVGGPGFDIIYGRNGNDEINGGDDTDHLFGEVGEDLLIGGRGNDILVGGFQSDTLFGDEGNDRLIGGYDDTLGGQLVDGSGDFLDGGDGRDVIAGDNAVVTQDGLDTPIPFGGDDVILGGDQDDLIYGQDGDDRIQGNGGDDVIEAMAGNDLVFGGSIICDIRNDPPNPNGPLRDRTPASDRNARQRNAREFESCFDDYRDPIPPQQTDPDQPPPPGIPPSAPDGADTIDGGSEHDRLYGDNWSPGFQEHTLGGAGDRISGRRGDDLIFGQVGDDMLQGQDDQDVMLGGDGNDTMEGGAGIDWMAGQRGDDGMTGGLDVDLLFGGFGRDMIEGNAGNDLLDGGAGADELSGGDGDDTLCGGPGPDLLFGGLGQDLLKGEGGNDLMFGEDGQDLMHGGFGSDEMHGGSQADRMFGNGGNDTMFGDDGNDVMDGGFGADRISGGAGRDRMFGRQGPDVLLGGAGADTIQGNGGNDLVLGGGGDDWIAGNSGDDSLRGGAGADTIRGDAGNDVINGNAGNDSLAGGDGADTIYGNSGADTILGGAGNDIVYGGGGDDAIDGGLNRDFLAGDAGHDLIRGGDHSDTLNGGGGNDILLGEGGDDVLTGGSGRDLLIGGRNTDLVDGGRGQDIVIGGFTDYDGNDAALRAILAEWTSVRSYASRLRNILGMPNPTFASRLNGNFFLIPSGVDATVRDDGAADSLFGGADQDWLFADPLDSVLDSIAGELVSLVS